MGNLVFLLCLLIPSSLSLFQVNLNISANNQMTQNIENNYQNHALLESLLHYEIVFLRQFDDFHLQTEKKVLSTYYFSNKTKIHSSKAFFSIMHEKNTYVLDIVLNNVLLPNTYSVSTYTKDGKLQIHKPSKHEVNHCYYQGRVRNFTDSQVAVSTCNGLRGYISLPNKTLIIEPLFDNLQDEHVVYLAEDMKQFNTTTSCGTEHSNMHMFNVIKNFNRFSDSNNFQRLKRSSGERMFVELLIVADHAEAQLYQDRIELEKRIKDIVNFVDGFYQNLNIRVVLSHVEVWNHTNLISDSTNAQEVLNEFLTFCQNQKASSSSPPAWRRVDNYHLLSGKNFDGITVGMATVKTMCTSRSGGVNQDGRASAINTAAILAHEMGHNFGMGHDTNDCVCKEDYQCLMAPSLGYGSNQDWSDCSRLYLKQSLGQGLGSCLLNTPDPSTIYGGPLCGNDIVEEGEECDCGFPNSCTSTCCDPETCKLLPHAFCDVGLCCKDCNYLASGTICRVAGSECDLPEYCTGFSPHCPINVYRLNNALCNGGTAACFDSVCLSLDMQCESVWGKGASAGTGSCFTKVNSFGNNIGNCGRDQNGGYKNCSVENAKCGKLVCQNGQTHPLVSRNRYTYVTTLQRPDGSTYKCKTIASDSTDTDVTDLGLVRTGTLCDTGKVCNDGVCQIMTSSSCDNKCHGRGVCNNLQNCHCERGWGPPYCAVKGNGGSIDSGPIEYDTTDYSVVLMIVLAGVVLPLVLAIGFYAWYRYFGGKIQIKTWKKNRQRRLDAVAVSKGKVPKSRRNLPLSTPTTSPNRKAHKYVAVSSSKGTKNEVSIVASPPSRPPPPRPQQIPSTTPPASKPPPVRKAPPPPKSNLVAQWQKKIDVNDSTSKRRPPPRPALPTTTPSKSTPGCDAMPTTSVRERMSRFNQL